MRLELGKKKAVPNSDWAKVFENIDDYVTRTEVDLFASKAVRNIRTIARGNKCAIAWSGGKDSIVIRELAERAGIFRGAFVHTDLEYPEFLRWASSNTPTGIETINTGYDLEWLANNQRFLFPCDARTRSEWYARVQQYQTKMYAKRNSIDVMIFGRRRAEGNSVTSRNSSIYNCIAEWPHEIVLGFIHYNNIELPPFYTWKDGFTHGTHAWSARSSKGKTHEQVWREIYQIDKSIVFDASKHIQSASDFLESM